MTHQQGWSRQHYWSIQNNIQGLAAYACKLVRESDSEGVILRCLMV